MIEDIRLSEVWAKQSSVLNVSQGDAARALGFRSQGAVSQYLSGRVPLGLEAACKFAKFLQVPLSQISKTYADLAAGALLGPANGLLKSVVSGKYVSVKSQSGSLFVDPDCVSIDSDGSYLIEIKGETNLWAIKTEGELVTLTSDDKTLQLPVGARDVLAVRGKVVAQLMDLCQS